MLRKLGLIGAVFFIANALAVVASLVILFMRRGRQNQLAPGRRCAVCSAALPVIAKYCHECGSRA